VLHQQLAFLESEPLEGGLRWLVPTLVALAAASGAALFFILGEPMFAGLFLAGCVAMLVAAFAIDRRASRAAPVVTLVLPDHGLVGTAYELVADPVALTRGDGELVTFRDQNEARCRHGYAGLISALANRFVSSYCPQR
jgi:two-component system cell cycle sensor histidine kinase/response regulator CckA